MANAQISICSNAPSFGAIPETLCLGVTTGRWAYQARLTGSSMDMMTCVHSSTCQQLTGLVIPCARARSVVEKVSFGGIHKRASSSGKSASTTGWHTAIPPLAESSMRRTTSLRQVGLRSGLAANTNADSDSSIINGGKLYARRSGKISCATATGQSTSDTSPSDSGTGGSNTSLATKKRENSARIIAKRNQSYEITELQRPLGEYMALPASQYSVLDAERIERVDDNTFKCYVHTLKFFALEVCPVLLVRVDQKPNGCIIRLLSCTLVGSPIVAAQNKKFSASMKNEVSWKDSTKSPNIKELVSDTTIEVILDVPGPFRVLPIDLIESTGNSVLNQLLRVVLPRFLSQLGKDYKAWASGDESRKPLGTGQL